ncbi:helix-turn-helix transcriptional regulator [Psychromonas ossibalaenae]|uniref:helix-turn-helix transcriptional regulator n=1 Tax=Psychromonas ossibalaenae TaxID=444922 RepID=UPI0003778D1B|nr:helix-turn-helix transcriptional regulator [Psychromonas ossibalaenae]
MEINDSPKMIAETLGLRLKQARLNANLSQETLALKVGLSKNTIVNVEAGRTKLETMIAVMQGLDLLDQLSLFLAEQPISPIQLAKLKGAQRKRASKSKAVQNNNNDESTPEW